MIVGGGARQSWSLLFTGNFLPDSSFLINKGIKKPDSLERSLPTQALL